MPASASLNDSTYLTGSSRASFSERLKTKFIPAVRDYWADYKNHIMGLLAQNTGERLEGLRTVTVAGTGMPAGAGTRRQDQRLPTATASSSIQLELGPKKLEMTLEMQPELEGDARGGASSWEKAYAFELKALMNYYEIRKNDIAMVGRGEVLGKHASTMTAGVVSIQPITARNSTASAFFNRGMLDPTSGTLSSHPFYKNMRVSLVPNASGALGSPNTGAAWPSGDRSTANDNVADDEVYIGSIGASETAPTLTYHQRSTSGGGSGGDTPVGATTAALTGLSTGWIIPYASRAPSITSGANGISQFGGYEGIESYLSDTYGYSAVLGQAKTAAAGLNPIRNVGPSNADRVYSDGLMNVVMRVLKNRRDDGVFPGLTLCTWAGWERVSAQYDTYKRMEPVIGKGGTTAVGNTPDGFMLHAGAGSVVFKPRAMCLPKAMYLLDPAGWKKMPNMEFELVDPLGYGRDMSYDTKRWNFIERFNIMCEDIVANAVIYDLTEDPFSPLT